MKNEALKVVAATPVQAIPAEGTELAIGQWYWVDPDGKDNWLGCITHIGSNYAELTGIKSAEYGTPQDRIHLNEFDERCKRELNAEQIINDDIIELQQKSQKLMAQVQQICAQLAIPTRQSLSDGGGETQALALRGNTQPIGEYKKALIKAKDKSLPKLFKEIEKVNEQMANLMKAPLIAMQAEADALKPILKTIKGRIFNVELYAGLVEEVKQIKKGKPADMNEPIHLFQRRAYMDEECLAEYETGGMTFKSLGEFDKWVVRQPNLNRLLPFPRCILAFQIRRKEKERSFDSLSAHIKFLFSGEADWDKMTFLYIRNGQQVFRLSTEIDFGSRLFPDTELSDLNGVIYAKMFAHSVDEVIGESEYLGEIERHKEARIKYAKQIKELRAKKVPRKDWWGTLGFGGGPRDETKNYRQWTPDDVYYDDIEKHLKDQIDKHNRLVLVLQGLLDRSPVLHPHPPWQLWSPEGFEQAMKLIYDDSRGLTTGEKPDFEAYRAGLNKTLKFGSITIGQDDYWQRKEADKYNRECHNNWRIRDHYDVSHYSPYGNPGPGKLAAVQAYSKKGCRYNWTRERLGRDRWGPQDDIKCMLTVPESALLNVSAYKPGDFKQFFNDPRTRADYIQWAPMLLEAEEYHAGNRKAGKGE